MHRWARLLLAIYWPALAIATHWEKIPVLDTIGPETGYPDKIMHFGCFAMLTVLLVYAQPFGRARRFITNLTMGTLIVAVYACVDELTQGWFGRTVAMPDLLTNLSAVLIAYTAILLSHENGWDLQRSPTLIARMAVPLILPVAWLVLFGTAIYWVWAVRLIRLLPGVDVGGSNSLAVDTAGHFILSAVAVPLLVITRPVGQRRRWLGFVLVIIAVAASALLIERLQSYFQRSVETRDIIAHLLGTAVGGGLWLLGAAVVAIVRCSWRSMMRRWPRGNMGNNNAPKADFASHAFTVGVFTFVSRLTGLLRDAMLGAAFGLTGVLGAFTVGFMVPNLFRRLFGEGALAAAFIPNYVEAIKKDPVMARRLASLCIAVLLIVTAGLTLFGELLLVGLMQARTWSDDGGLAIRLTMIMLPYMPMICVVALVGGMLQVRGKFGAPAAAPILLNLVVIGATVFAVSGVRGEGPLRLAMPVVAIGVLIAGVAQLIWQFAALLRLDTLTWRWKGAGALLRPIGVMMLPMVVGLAVFQINALLDVLIAFGLAPSEGGPDSFHLFGWVIQYPIADQGAAAALSFGQRLYQFPLGVFGIALATAIFPALANAASGSGAGTKLYKGTDAFRTTLQQGLRLTIFIGLPATVGLILVRLPLVRLIFEHGKFDIDSSQRVAMIMAGYASGVWAYSMTHVLTRAFYAMKDSMTPLRISVGMVALNLMLNLSLIWPFGTAGLAWSTAISAVVQVVILLFAVKRYVAHPVSSEVLRGLARCAVLTAVMAAVLVPILFVFDPAQLPRTQSAILLAVLVVAGAAIYLGGALVWRLDELSWLRRRNAQ